MKHTTLLFILIFSFLLISPALGDAADATPGEAQKVLYLTFDDGPKASTPELLDILKTYDAPATFFLVGQGIQNNPEAARAICPQRCRAHCADGFLKMIILPRHQKIKFILIIVKINLLSAAREFECA